MFSHFILPLLLYFFFHFFFRFILITLAHGNVFYSYNCVFLVLTYGVPMLIMIVCYTIMGRVLWGSQSIGEHTQRQIESIKSKKKVCIARWHFCLARITQIIHCPRWNQFIFHSVMTSLFPMNSSVPAEQKEKARMKSNN